jgi:hypothetical protein
MKRATAVLKYRSQVIEKVDKFENLDFRRIQWQI